MQTSRWRVLLVIVVLVSICASAVKAAVTVDLTGGAGSSGYANGAYFEWVDENSTGTGVIDSFLRIQATGTERGYNTDGTLEFDTKSSHTKALLLSAVPTVEIDSVLYREFLLDIGESSAGSEPLLSLDTIEIYLTADRYQTGYPALGTKVFDLDIGLDGDATVIMNASLNPGNGWGDIFAYIPESFFADADDDDYVCLYSEFGGLWPSSSSPEEWAVRLSVTPPPPPPVPAPAAVLLALVGSSAVITAYRRRKF
jgi:hypothetical protein